MANKIILNILCFIFLFGGKSFTQEVVNLDSLYKLIPKTIDTSLVHLYIKIGQQYEGTELDSAKVYYKKAEVLSEQINYKIGVLKYISNYTYILNLEGKFEEGLALNKKGITIAQEIKNDFQIAAAYANTAASFQYLEKYELAVEYYLKAIEYTKKTKNEDRLGIIYSNLCGLYETLEQNEKSLSYAIEAEKIARKYQLKADLANALTNKTTALCNLGRYAEAGSIIDEVLELARVCNNDYLRMVNLTNKCQVLMYLNRNAELKPYAEEANILSKKFNNVDGELNSLIALSDYYMNTNAYQMSYDYAQQALFTSQKNGSLEYIKKCAMNIANACLTLHDMKGFHKYAMLHDSLDRAINLDKTNKAIIDITTKYDTDKKNLQIQALESKSKKRLWISIALTLGILSITIIAFMQYQSFVTKKKLLLVEQEKAVAEERLRIASDMHDDVGTGLSRIRYIANSVKLGETTQDIGLNKVAAISDETITKMSEIIWALNETNQTLEELIYFIRSQASEMVENADILFEGNLPENIPAISFGWMRNRNTYLLVKETIHNSIKHANANKISIKFEVLNELTISIQDDGKGFNTSKKYSGNGLHNYQKRIQKINGTMLLDSKIGSGTKVTYKIPFV